MLADIGDFDGVRPDSLHGHDSALHDKGFSDDKCVGMVAAFQQLLLLYILLEVLDRENAHNKSGLFGCRHPEDFLMDLRPFPQGIWAAVVDFSENLAC